MNFRMNFPEFQWQNINYITFSQVPTVIHAGPNQSAPLPRYHSLFQGEAPEALKKPEVADQTVQLIKDGTNGEKLRLVST